jgi:ribokinase
LKLDAIGFGSLNIDEFWEVTPEFFQSHDLRSGEEYVRDLAWFSRVYSALRTHGHLKVADPGGSAANMIAALSRMGFETGFYGATGENDAELLRLNELGRPENLHVKSVPMAAGRCLALIDSADPARDRALVILPNANDMAGSEGIDPDYFRQSRWVHLTSFVSPKPLAAQIELAESLSGETRVSFDPGAVYVALGIRALTPLIRRSDVLFVTIEELQALTREKKVEIGAAHLLKIGARCVVVKLGAEGIMGFRHETVTFQPAVSPAALVDRTGAGDVAAAGFLAGILKCLSLERCLALAAAAAAKSIEGYGRTAYPDKAFLEKCISALTGEVVASESRGLDQL